jgi:hypothetical protein
MEVGGSHSLIHNHLLCLKLLWKTTVKEFLSDLTGSSQNSKPISPGTYRKKKKKFKLDSRLRGMEPLEHTTAITKHFERKI